VSGPSGKSGVCLYGGSGWGERGAFIWGTCRINKGGAALRVSYVVPARLKSETAIVRVSSTLSLS